MAWVKLQDILHPGALMDSPQSCFVHKKCSILHSWGMRALIPKVMGSSSMGRILTGTNDVHIQTVLSTSGI